MATARPDPAAGDSVEAGVRAAAALIPPAFAFGLTFGVLAGEAGIRPLATLVMSLTTFAGSAQYAAAAVLDDGGTAASAVLAALLLNARYFAFGVALAPALHGGPLARFATAQLMTDESWAVAHRGGGRFSRRRFLGAAVVVYATWNGGTLAGVAGGEVIGDPAALGLDAAIPALFLALLVRGTAGRPAIVAALLGGATALLTTPVLPPGGPLIAAGCVPIVMGLGSRR